MQTLTVNPAEKVYRYYQLYGFADGTLVGEVKLNGVTLHELRGESCSTANNAAQTAVKHGENVIELVLQSGSGEVEYVLHGASGPEDDMDPDRLVEFQETIALAPGQTSQLQFRFVLDGPAFTLLKP